MNGSSKILGPIPVFFLRFEQKLLVKNDIDVETFCFSYHDWSEVDKFKTNETLFVRMLLESIVSKSCHTIQLKLLLTWR